VLLITILLGCRILPIGLKYKEAGQAERTIYFIQALPVLPR
jgi:hypothetical protein